ncbi:FAD-binding domain-containing protein [Zavarzinia sp. CC-PAN008]|uniref:FAD-binding domain-containing protein n=1 Tax=Zavarzinia sp. CC-PAN008 TaxID=3243332 RepID=UPI003F74991B
MPVPLPLPPGLAPDLAQVDWSPTRAAGLARLAAFLPNAGHDYAHGRNDDRGPRDRANVSALSPWIRRRLLTEPEVIAAAIAAHGPQAAHKFVQEVVWRSYWKGWLEQHPAVHARYEAQRPAIAGAWATNPRLGPRLDAAEQGRTGIDCFDAWMGELRQTGWLHNHARMWFASIWIFTLRLPWVLGADLFRRHLLDFDPASNTLSWRWVAGLHTPGKHYLARAQNIRRHTAGRFDPSGQLDEAALPLAEPGDPPARAGLPRGDRSAASRVALLLTAEDLHPESWPLEADVAGIGALPALHDHAPGSPAQRFSDGAIQDGLARAGSHFGPAGMLVDADAVAEWAAGLGVVEVVTALAPQGPEAARLVTVEAALAARGIRLVRLLRPWDAAAWPHATAGFFRMARQIPALVAGL